MDKLAVSRNLRSFLIAGVLILALLTACLPPSTDIIKPPHPWASALRALDPADAPTPAYDITAAYLRTSGNNLQIRIDLLNFQSPGNLSLDIRVGDNSAPEADPLDIHIPSETDSNRITLDPLLATVIVDFPLSEIPSHPRVDVFTPEDEIHGLTLEGTVPTQTVPLLLTFYDTFVGRFPAEALRSWDGAHSGPRGERHGLKYLLDTVEENQVPIVLLDLKEPENLSALDAMGVLPTIESPENQGLIFYPKNNDNDLQFIYLEDTTHLYKPWFSKTTYSPIAIETNSNQPTPDGPSLEVRRALLEAALNNDKKDLLVLGGSLANSTWGNPDMVGATMAYFTSRPYIHVLNAEDLSAFPTNTVNTIIPQPEEPADELAVHVQATLEFAQDWAENPPDEIMMIECQEISPKCVLANASYLALFDSQITALTYLFTRDQTGLHQLIGPSWQVAPGIDIYPAAFADDKTYTPTIKDDSLIFTSMDGSRTKTFTLTEFGLEVNYQSQEPVTVQIPLLVDPDVRFTPGWAEKYVGEITSNRIHWGLENGLMVSVQAEGAVTLRAFNESLLLLATLEDPDLDYPPGHYVPFPMAIVDVAIRDGYVFIARQ